MAQIGCFRFQQRGLSVDVHHFVKIANRESDIYRRALIDVDDNRSSDCFFESSFFHSHLIATNFKRAENELALSVRSRAKFRTAFGVDNPDLCSGDDRSAWVFDQAG